MLARSLACFGRHSPLDKSNGFHMHHLFTTSQSASAKDITARIRIKPSMHLCSGDAVGAFAEHARTFDERPVFTHDAGRSAHLSPAEWVVRSVSDLAVICQTLSYNERPIVLPIPACAFSQPGLVDACDHAIAQTQFANQEISFEITDAAAAATGALLQNMITAFRKKGFRISIDARKSWTSRMPAPCWLMIDTLRICPHHIETEAELEDMISIARSAGVAIVAQKPHWRDGEYLASLGIDYGLNPRTDS